MPQNEIDIMSYIYYILPMFTSLGQNVYLYRIVLGQTQVELARKSGIPRPNLSDIEKGKRDATLTTVHKIAQALQVSAGDLVDGKPPSLLENTGSRSFLEKVAEAIATGDFHSLTKMQKTAASFLSGQVQERIMAAGHRPTVRHRSSRRIERDWIVLKTLLPQGTINALLQRLDKHLRMRTHSKHE